MSDERRYQEDEVREIFGTAADADDPTPRHASSGPGLTLAELQEIGREVGLEPDRIAEAAAALDLRHGTLPRRTFLGMPISVGRVVDLPRAPTDREWEILVAELRETFRARGKVSSSGNLRQWTNSNLHAMVEPTAEGYRLRMGTLKGSARSGTVLGVAALALAGFQLVSLLVTGGISDPWLPPLLAAAGLGTLISNALRLPQWAREREEQMAYLAARALALTGSGQPGDAEEP